MVKNRPATELVIVQTLFCYSPSSDGVVTSSDFEQRLKSERATIQTLPTCLNTEPVPNSDVHCIIQHFGFQTHYDQKRVRKSTFSLETE